MKQIKSKIKSNEIIKKPLILNRKYYYLIKSNELYNIKYKEIPVIEFILENFKKRGNWEEFNTNNPQVKNPDFVYTDWTYKLNKNFLLNYNVKIRNSLDESFENYSISNKYNLIENLKKTNINKKHLLNQIDVNIYNIFKKYNYYMNIYQNWFKKYKVLILKGIFSYAGLDIEVFTEFKDFKNFIDNLINEKNIKNFDIDKYNKINGLNKKFRYNIEWVLQEYITNPLLFEERKFHMRGIFFYNFSNNKKKGYLYDDLLLITAKLPYVNGDYKNKEIHDSHFKTTIREFMTLDKDFKNIYGEEKVNYIFNQTKYIVKYIYKLINAKCYPEVKNCFNIYGFDIMILDDFTVKIIENNYDPALKYPQEFFDLMFEKNIDCFLPPKNPQPKVNNYIEL